MHDKPEPHHVKTAAVEGETRFWTISSLAGGNDHRTRR